MSVLETGGAGIDASRNVHENGLKLVGWLVGWLRWSTDSCVVREERNLSRASADEMGMYTM
jgi:hypothetical protein